MGGVGAGAAFFASGKRGSASAFAVPSDNRARCHRTGQRRRGAQCRERVRLGKRQMRCARIRRCDMGKASNKLRSRCARSAGYRCGTTTLSRRQVATLRRRAAHCTKPLKMRPQRRRQRERMERMHREAGTAHARTGADRSARAPTTAQRTANAPHPATMNRKEGYPRRKRRSLQTPTPAQCRRPEVTTCLRRTARSPSPARPRGRSLPGSSAGGGRSR